MSDSLELELHMALSQGVVLETESRLSERAEGLSTTDPFLQTQTLIFKGACSLNRKHLHTGLKG